MAKLFVVNFAMSSLNNLNSIFIKGPLCMSLLELNAFCPRPQAWFSPCGSTGTLVRVFVSSRSYFLDAHPCVGVWLQFEFISLPKAWQRYRIALAILLNKNPGVRRHVGGQSSGAWWQRPVFWISRARTLFEPRATRAEVPQEAPGVLPCDGGRQVFPHLQRKNLPRCDSVLVAEK